MVILDVSQKTLPVNVWLSLDLSQIQKVAHRLLLIVCQKHLSYNLRSKRCRYLSCMHDLMMIKIQTKFAAMVWLTAWGRLSIIANREKTSLYISVLVGKCRVLRRSKQHPS
jgi:hypothetical protein